ncbi:MAG: PQQ-binding-like beta-propeller repeat protein, partial [Holophagales bacterium]|nr:PQQ-binding-like beta-propeller repeat protein [Holophagales bacterium]
MDTAAVDTATVDTAATEGGSPTPGARGATAGFPVAPSGRRLRSLGLLAGLGAVLALGALLLLEGPPGPSAPDRPEPVSGPLGASEEAGIGEDDLPEADTGAGEVAGAGPVFDRAWSAVLGEEIWAPPAVDGTVVYAGSDAGQLVALDRRTGEARWRLPLGHPLRRRAVSVGEAVLAVDEGGILYAAAAASGAELWRLAGGFTTAPVVLGGAGRASPSRVVLADRRGRLVALEAASGKRIWRRMVASGAVSGEPASGLGQVIVSDSAGRIHALDAHSGELRWSVEVGADPTPARLGGASVFLVADGFLVALRAADGQELWRTQTSELVGLPPAVAGDRVLVAGGHGRLYAFDALRGVERWRRHGDGYLRSAPVVAEGLAFVGAGEHHLFALDPGSGEGRWSFETDAIVTGALAVGEGQMLFGSVEGRLHALPIELPSPPSPPARGRKIEPELRVGPSFFDGVPTLRFERSLSAVGWAPPLVRGEGSEGRIYQGTGAGLLVLDAATGRPVWKLEGGAVDAAPALDAAHDRLVFGDRDGRVRAVALEDGEPAWEVRAAGAVLGRPIAAEGRVFFGATDGALYALRTADGSALWKARAEGRVGAPALLGGLVIVPSCGGRVLAVAADSGREMWRRPRGPCVVAAWAGRDSIFAVDARGEMVSLEPAVGGERWRKGLGAGVAHDLAVV